MFNWFKRKEIEQIIALPPDLTLANEAVKKKIDASREKEEKTFYAFQIWLSRFVSDWIKRDLSGQWVYFSIEIRKDGHSGTECGSIFRMFYEQGDNVKLAFSQELLHKMKQWILGDFSLMYTTAGYKVVVSDKRFEISWTQVKSPVLLEGKRTENES